MSKIALISSYWVYDKNIRSKIEMEWLDEYLDWIVKYFNENKNFSEIIICWWYTSKESELSESESFRNILLERFREKNINISLKVENTSFITYENFVFWVLSLRNKDIKNLLIIADKHREYKVKIESKLLFEPVWIELEYLFLDRKDTHPNSNFEKQSFETLPRDLQSESFLKLKSFFHEAMKK